jgi:hypothetical protein
MGISVAYGSADADGGAAAIRRAHMVLPVSALQTECSLFERDVERARNDCDISRKTSGNRSNRTPWRDTKA